MELRKRLESSEDDLSRFNSVKGDLTLLEIKYESTQKQLADLEEGNQKLSKEVIEVTEKYKQKKKKIKKEREFNEKRDLEIKTLKQ